MSPTELCHQVSRVAGTLGTLAQSQTKVALGQEELNLVTQQERGLWAYQMHPWAQERASPKLQCSILPFPGASGSARQTVGKGPTAQWCPTPAPTLSKGPHWRFLSGHTCPTGPSCLFFPCGPTVIFIP